MSNYNNLPINIIIKQKPDRASALADEWSG